MDKAVSAADANRRFSELLRTMKQGGSAVVTSHGKPVARITPVIEDDRAAAGARSALFARPAEHCSAIGASEIVV
jgi:prevent-host-death family protein